MVTSLEPGILRESVVELWLVFWLKVGNVRTMIAQECAFCFLPKRRVVFENSSGFAFFDDYPVSTGHMLVIPKRHSCSLFELPESDQSVLWQLVAQARLHLKKQFNPDGFNIGLNEGKSAGQTISHIHFHVIPRYKNDVLDPRGGIRWVIPEKAKYW